MRGAPRLICRFDGGPGMQCSCCLFTAPPRWRRKSRAPMTGVLVRGQPEAWAMGSPGGVPLWRRQSAGESRWAWDGARQRGSATGGEKSDRLGHERPRAQRVRPDADTHAHFTHGAWMCAGAQAHRCRRRCSTWSHTEFRPSVVRTAFGRASI